MAQPPVDDATAALLEKGGPARSSTEKEPRDPSGHERPQISVFGLVPAETAAVSAALSHGPLAADWNAECEPQKFPMRVDDPGDDDDCWDVVHHPPAPAIRDWPSVVDQNDTAAPTVLLYVGTVADGQEALAALQAAATERAHLNGGPPVQVSAAFAVVRTASRGTDDAGAASDCTDDVAVFDFCVDGGDVNAEAARDLRMSVRGLHPVQWPELPPPAAATPAATAAAVTISPAIAPPTAPPGSTATTTTYGGTPVATDSMPSTRSQTTTSGGGPSGDDEVVDLFQDENAARGGPPPPAA